MRLEPLFDQEIEQIKQEYEERIQQYERERRTIIEGLLQFRFGSIDEELAAIIEPFAVLPSAEYSALIPQLSNLSREELLTRFQP
jgi:hypothetical protein